MEQRLCCQKCDKAAEEELLEGPFFPQQLWEILEPLLRFVACFCCHRSLLLSGLRYLDLKVCKEDRKDAGVTDEAAEAELVSTRSVSFQLCQIYILSNLVQLFSPRNTCQRPRPPLY